MTHMAKDDKSVLGWFVFIVSVMAVALALFGLRSGSASGAAASTAGSVDVTLSEFRFSPLMISLPAEGGTIRISNTGSAVHSLTVPELGLKSGDISPGATAQVTVGPVAAGMYKVLCEIAGHAANGMTASLMIGGDPGSAATAGAPATMTWQEMDATMADVAGQFPATTAGHGGDRMEPKVLADGTKEFDIEAKIVKWEVAPGKLVDAWTYNGVVPAPEIHVIDGDKVRIVLKNSLPESTSLHLHGIRVPNAMDGVDPYTQPPIRPGALVHLRVRGQRPRRRHLPLAPQRSDPGSQWPVRRLHDRRDADPPGARSTRATPRWTSR